MPRFPLTYPEFSSYLFQPGAINKFGHYYDLTRTMDSGLLDRADLKTVDITDSFCERLLFQLTI